MLLLHHALQLLLVPVVHPVRVLLLLRVIPVVHEEVDLLSSLARVLLVGELALPPLGATSFFEELAHYGLGVDPLGNLGLLDGDAHHLVELALSLFLCGLALVVLALLCLRLLLLPGQLLDVSLHIAHELLGVLRGMLVLEAEDPVLLLLVLTLAALLVFLPLLLILGTLRLLLELLLLIRERKLGGHRGG